MAGDRPELFARRRIDGATREYGVAMYIMPLMTSGVTSLELKPAPPRPRPAASPVAGADGFM